MSSVGRRAALSAACSLQSAFCRLMQWKLLYYLKNSPVAVDFVVVGVTRWSSHRAACNVARGLRDKEFPNARRAAMGWEHSFYYG